MTIYLLSQHTRNNLVAGISVNNKLVVEVSASEYGSGNDLMIFPWYFEKLSTGEQTGYILKKGF